MPIRDTRAESESLDLAIVKSELQNIKQWMKDAAEDRRSLGKAIYGFEEKQGIYNRIQSLEGKMNLIWRAIAVFGAAVITIFLNAIFGIVKTH